jgi:hypothetical protein
MVKQGDLVVKVFESRGLFEPAEDAS